VNRLYDCCCRFSGEFYNHNQYRCYQQCEVRWWCTADRMNPIIYCRSGTRERKYCGIILREKIPICDASYDSPVDTTHTCTSCSKWATTFLIFNKSVISHLVRWQRGTARIRPPLRQQLIDISNLPGPRQQTYSSRFAAVSPCWGSRQKDRQTDG